MSEQAYFIVHLQVTDFDAYFENYVGPLLSQFEEYGAKVLAATAEPDVREGELFGNWHVVLEFPSVTSAQAWYTGHLHALPAAPNRVGHRVVNRRSSLAVGYPPDCVRSGARPERVLRAKRRHRA